MDKNQWDVGDCNDCALMGVPACDEICKDRSSLIQYAAELMAEIERYKIMIFMVARIRVMEVGLRIGKSEQEINSMALDTAKQMFNMIDFDRAKEIYAAAVEENK